MNQVQYYFKKVQKNRISLDAVPAEYRDQVHTLIKQKEDRDSSVEVVFAFFTTDISDPERFVHWLESNKGISMSQVIDLSEQKIQELKTDYINRLK